MRFNFKFFIATLFLLMAEVSIATILKDIAWLRAYFGDVLVVILIYTFVLSFFEINNKNFLNLGIFIFACAIEFAQYFHFAELLGFQDNKMAMIVLGNSFSWIDILCYAFGCLFVLSSTNRFIFDISRNR